ncbi:MAG TPA: thiamine pyrophosphate-dependent enzyme [Dehalococcoidia bacterium]|nr:thiamine pyrophosphate-dependent enzyme [Dehalococcoidia bacterium]
MIIAGYGARFHIPHLTALAEQLGAPIATIFKAKGLVADNHELAAGVLGRSGTLVASWLMNEADLLIVLGASFSDYTGIAEYKPIIPVDFDPMAIEKSHAVTVPVLAGVGAACEQIAAALGTVAAVDQRADVAQRWQIWRAEKARRAEDDRGRGVNAASIFAALTRHAPQDAVIAVDVGNNTYSFGRYFESSGDQSVLMPGYLGSIGFGYPAAMGAWAPAPDRPTIAVTGDGGFGQYLGELTTAVKYGMNITHVLLNDGALGIRVTERADLDAAVERAFAHDGPALVEVVTDSDLL